VRNSSLVEWSRADNPPGLKPRAEAAEHEPPSGALGLVGERGVQQRSSLVRAGGAHTSENAGMSSVRRVSKRAHRMAEVSYGRFILVGLVGPKPRPKGVGDGQTVYIPLPLADDKVRAQDALG
jgi:hypothetical protein